MLAFKLQIPQGDKQPKPKLPVIVWIHGGSFYYGSGAEYGPSYLLDEKVVLVTLNYRLGILGNDNHKTLNVPKEMSH